MWNKKNEEVLSRVRVKEMTYGRLSKYIKYYSFLSLHGKRDITN